MSDSGFESLALAKQFKAWITAEVSAQIQKIAPRRRVAEVTAIDLSARRAKVIYVGETNEVSLPFNLAIPAFVGQYVVVDGPPQDRSIVDVLGESGIEQKVTQNMAQTPLPEYWVQQDLDVLESLPMWFYLATEGPTYQFLTGELNLLPLRATVDSVFSQAAIHLTSAGSTNNRITLLAYLRSPSGVYNLVGKTPEIVPASGTLRGTFDNELSVQRGDRMFLGVHVSGTGTSPTSIAKTSLRTPLGITAHSGFGLAHVGVSEIPVTVDTAQVLRYYETSAWGALIR